MTGKTHTRAVVNIASFNGNFVNSSSIGKEVRPRKFTAGALSSSLTAHKTQTPSYIYMQSTLVAAILLRNEIYATLPKLKRDVTGRHYNARNSDVSLSPAQPAG